MQVESMYKCTTLNTTLNDPKRDDRWPQGRDRMREWRVKRGNNVPTIRDRLRRGTLSNAERENVSLAK